MAPPGPACRSEWSAVIQCCCTVIAHKRKASMSDKPVDVSAHSQDRNTLLENELGRFLPLLQRHYRPYKIILFGSLAAGQVGEWSDLDLVIVAETDKRFL